MKRPPRPLEDQEHLMRAINKIDPNSGWGNFKCTRCGKRFQSLHLVRYHQERECPGMPGGKPGVKTSRFSNDNDTG